MKLPKGWTVKAFGELFTNEQLSHILELWNDHHQDEIELQRKLAAYLATFKDELEKKGLNYLYASYAIPYWLKEAVKQQQETLKNRLN